MRRIAAQPTHAHAQGKRRVGPRVRGLVIISAGLGSMLFSTGVFAAWAPTGSITSSADSAATLTVNLADTNGTTFTTGVSNLLPGDYLNRYVDITNNGTVAQTYSAALLGSGLLGPALTAQVDVCSVAWNGAGACTGTTTPVLAATATNPVANASFASIAASGVAHARFRYTLIASAVQATYQGTSTTESVTVTGSATVAGGADRTAG